MSRDMLRPTAPAPAPDQAQLAAARQVRAARREAAARATAAAGLTADSSIRASAGYRLWEAECKGLPTAPSKDSAALLAAVKATAAYRNWSP